MGLGWARGFRKQGLGWGRWSGGGDGLAAAVEAKAVVEAMVEQCGMSCGSRRACEENGAVLWCCMAAGTVGIGGPSSAHWAWGQPWLGLGGSRGASRKSQFWQVECRDSAAPRDVFYPGQHTAERATENSAKSECRLKCARAFALRMDAAHRASVSLRRAL